MLLKPFLLKKALPTTVVIVPVYLTVELINGSKLSEPLVSPILLNDAPTVKIDPIPLPAGNSSDGSAKIQLLDSQGGSSGGSKSIRVPQISGNSGGSKSKPSGSQSTSSTTPKPPASTTPSTPAKPPSGGSTSSKSEKDPENPEAQLAALIKGMVDGQDRITSNPNSLPVMYEVISKMALANKLIAAVNKKNAQSGASTGTPAAAS